MPRGRPKKEVIEELRAEEAEQLDEPSAEESPGLSSLKAQWQELHALRLEMNRLGIDSISKLDALASQLQGEINKSLS